MSEPTSGVMVKLDLASCRCFSSLLLTGLIGVPRQYNCNGVLRSGAGDQPERKRDS